MKTSFLVSQEKVVNLLRFGRQVKEALSLEGTRVTKNRVETIGGARQVNVKTG